MEIRRARPSDLATLVALHQEAQELHADAHPGRFRRNPPDEDLAVYLSGMIDSPSSLILVADEGAPVGFVSADFRHREENWCSVSRENCYLASLCVAPAFRRTGVARRLIEALQHEAINRGCPEIELDVWNFNTPARGLFAELGFQPLFERLSLRHDPSD